MGSSRIRKRDTKSDEDLKRRSLSRRKMPKLTAGTTTPKERSKPIDDETSNPPTTSPSSAGASFLNHSFYNSGTNRGVESYQQYLESITPAVKKECENNKDTLFSSDWNMYSQIQRWSPDIPDDERIIELDDDDKRDKLDTTTLAPMTRGSQTTKNTKMLSDRESTDQPVKK